MKHWKRLFRLYFPSTIVNVFYSFLDVKILPKARVFISSSSQREFLKLRQRTSDLLKQLGHEPIMWETSFGAWPNKPDKSTIDKCLDEVKTSDVYFLFIADKAGSYIETDDSSVTHLELTTALKYRKRIVVFVEESVSQLYLDSVKAKIFDAIKQEAEMRKTVPDMVPIFEVVKSIQDLPEGIDPYTWVILHDCYNHNIFLEPMELAVSLDERMREYLTDSLRRGVALLPFEDRIAHNEEQATEYATYLTFTRNLLNMYRSKDWRTFLFHLSEVLSQNGGGEIIHPTGHRKEPLGSFRKCSSMSLYMYKDKCMERLEYHGLADGQPVYDLTETDKFVVQAYTAESGKDINLHYREDKQTLYLTVRAAGMYVLTLHFELEEKWTEDRVKACLQEIFKSVLYNHPNRNFVMYAQLVLEGGSSV